jgi:hypothetical protein
VVIEIAPSVSVRCGAASPGRGSWRTWTSRGSCPRPDEHSYPCRVRTTRVGLSAKARSCPLPTVVEVSPSLVLAFDVPACHGWRAPSHSMPGDSAPGARQAQTVRRTVCVRARSPGPGCARPSSLTSVGGCPPTLACHRLGIRRSKTTAVARRGQRVPFPVSRGGAGGASRRRGTWRERAPAVLGTPGHGTHAEERPRRDSNGPSTVVRTQTLPSSLDAICIRPRAYATATARRLP